MIENYLPVVMQAMVAIGFCASMLIMSVLLGKKGSKNSFKDTPYECGMLPIGDGAPRFSVKFYLVAMLFVIFDIEVVFLYPWRPKSFVSHFLLPPKLLLNHFPLKHQCCLLLIINQHDFVLHRLFLNPLFLMLC